MNTQRILLVDDSSEFLRSAERFLRSQAQLKVVGCAASGEAALQLSRDLSPDCVLIDLVMPGINGIEATRQIKLQPLPPKVILQSVHDSPQYRSAAQEAGADAFVAKSSFFSQILSTIESLMKEGDNLSRR